MQHLHVVLIAPNFLHHEPELAFVSHAEPLKHFHKKFFHLISIS